MGKRAMTLGQAIEADMRATGESRDDYARRRGLSRQVLDMLIDVRTHTAMAQLLAQEIAARLSTGEAGFIAIPRLQHRGQHVQLAESELPY